jgi:hypothetical protein
MVQAVDLAQAVFMACRLILREPLPHPSISRRGEQMSRCMSLEEYLERFVDENTQPEDEEITLIIPNSQAETLGHSRNRTVSALMSGLSRSRLMQMR